MSCKLNQKTKLCNKSTDPVDDQYCYKGPNRCQKKKQSGAPKKEMSAAALRGIQAGRIRRLTGIGPAFDLQQGGGDINELLVAIEDAYGDSKDKKVASLIKQLVANYSPEEIKAGMTAWEHSWQDLDPELYQKTLEALGENVPAMPVKADVVVDGEEMVWVDEAEEQEPEEQEEQEQEGGGCGYTPDQTGGGCGYTPDQTGGGCGFHVGRGRCYTNKTTTVDPECTTTTGAKGKQGCKRALAVHGPAAFGPKGYKKAATAAKKVAKVAKAVEAMEPAEDELIWVENPLFQEGGYWAPLSQVRQIGGGCGFHVGRGRCYTNKTTTVDPECTSTTGAKGKQGCKRAVAVEGPAAFGPKGYKKEKQLVWVDNPIFQEGGYWKLSR